VCALLRRDELGREVVVAPLVEAPLGIPASECQMALTQDVVRELVNKVAWTLGSVYRRNYSNMRTPAREYAWRIVKKVLEDHGYPDKIAK